MYFIYVWYVYSNLVHIWYTYGIGFQYSGSMCSHSHTYSMSHLANNRWWCWCWLMCVYWTRLISTSNVIRINELFDENSFVYWKIERCKVNVQFIYYIRYSVVSHRIVNKDGFVTSCDHIKLSRVNVNDIYTSVLFHHPIYNIQTKNKQRPCIVLYTGFLFKW